MIVCPLLPAITNGTIYYYPDVSTLYVDLGTYAAYICEAGFNIINQVRMCMEDDGLDAIGMWSGQEPSCVCKLSAKVYLVYVLYESEYV